ncbi:MAG: long-chain fatty acid--CoA ligase [Anaerolineae bacterium]|nr:long-chain fatty acid--CoA ligase [Anaerolineae bacterium]
MTIAVDWLAQRAALSPHKAAVHDTITGRSLTYAEWNAEANQTAHFLVGLGVQKGDRVCVLASNSLAYLDIWFACGKLGAILQNLNWRLAPREQEILIQNAAPRVLVYSAEFAAAVAELRPRLAVPTYVTLGDPAQPGDTPFAARDGCPTTPPDAPDLTLDDPWVICYTGGTTGVPKGAILTHGNITWNSINTVMSWGLAPDDVAILNAPLFHTGGLNVFTAPLVHIGGTSILCQTFNPDQVFDLIQHERVTLLFGVPTMFILLQQHPRWPEADFSRLKLVISGGAPCPLPVFERFWARGIDFKTGYGLTEAGPNTFWLPAEDVRRKPGAVGFPLFHIQVKLVDKAGQTVTAADTPGELLIRGPHVTPGYWNNPQATAQAIDVDGWLHTGDLAQRDAEGYYTVVGRVKDMIISGGENIYPAEVESVLHGHPAVVEAALIGVPDAHWGEVGRAIVVAKPGEAVTEAELRDHCRARLAGYKVPKSIVFVTDLPKTGANKVDKQALTARYG